VSETVGRKVPPIGLLLTTGSGFRSDVHGIMSVVLL
jgi:hypothetical protein